jgi:hypothetical protein
VQGNAKTLASDDMPFCSPADLSTRLLTFFEADDLEPSTWKLAPSKALVPTCLT